MRIFLTGSSSFIGAEVLRLCDERGHAVTGVDLAAPSRPDCHRADILDPTVADLIPEGVDAVVHLAALSRDSDCRNRALPCFSANVMGTLALMAAAEARGARQFIFASSEWVYDYFSPDRERTEDDPIDPAALASEYALSKLVSENNLRQASRHGFMPATVLRFGIVYGPRRSNWSAVESLLNDVAIRDVVKVGAVGTARRFLHVADIADAVLAAVGVPGFEVINIQGARLVTLGEVIAAAAALLGRRPAIEESSPGQANVRRVSSAKAERLMNWRAPTDLADGLRSVARHLDLV
ncbi:MAG: NAD(P)-dependent oxidoreductase [Alphaproteobacteria bacterium]